MSSGVGGRTFWPIGEAAQADYEMLRAYMLTEGDLPLSLPAVRFSRRGLAGLIAWPVADPVFTGPVLGAARPRWSPHHDPRVEALAAGFALLLRADVGAELDLAQGGAR